MQHLLWAVAIDATRPGANENDGAAWLAVWPRPPPPKCQWVLAEKSAIAGFETRDAAVKSL